MKNEVYNQAKMLRDRIGIYELVLSGSDEHARPCLKCNQLIEHDGGCLQINLGTHAGVNNTVRAQAAGVDPNNCSHNMCWDCLEDWPEVMKNRNHGYYKCSKSKRDARDHRKAKYSEKKCLIDKELSNLTGLPDKQRRAYG